MTLSPSQLKAVETDANQIVVMSGPGSGKTRVGVHRVQRLLDAAHDVQVLTFTNSGAHEFRQRIGAIDAKQSVSSVRAGAQFHCDTLHSYCFKIIRRFGHLIGYGHGNVAMLDDTDEVLEEVRDRFGCKMSLKALRESHEDPLAEQVWTEYRFKLKQNNLVDYDRVLTEGLVLLAQPEVSKELEIDDLIVDEAQDSAEVDWAIYQMIPAANKFFVGDVDQAIFEFRQAYPQGLLNIASAAQSTVLKLEENYRCAYVICRAANRLIQHNTSRFEKDTIPATDRMGTITVESFAEPWAELSRLANNASNHLANKDSVAVLCRTNHEFHRVRDYLSDRGFAIHNAEKGRYKPQDWRRAMLLIGLAVAPYNEIIAEQLLRLDYEPAEVAQWKRQAVATGQYLSDQFGHPIFQKPFQIEELLHYLAVNHVSEPTAELIGRRAQLLAEGATLADLLQDLQSNERIQQELPAGAIYTGTIHSAKGREFDCVFLPGFEDGTIPCGSFPVNEPPLEYNAAGLLNHGNSVKNIEEERRLAFVALTRARNAVHISFSWQRQRWGGTQQCKPSRFIGEMGYALLAANAD